MPYYEGFCRDGTGKPCDRGLNGHPLTAEVWVCTPAPEHKRIVAMCVYHAQQVIAEYHAKLGQNWVTESIRG